MGFVFCRPAVRTFETEHPLHEGQTLHLRAPLLETVRRLDSFEGLDEAIVLACEILSRNEEDENISAKELRAHVDYDQLREFLASFRLWLVSTRESDPN